MIDRTTTLEQLGAIVCQALKDAGIDSFLSGGAVVSIYSNNEFEIALTLITLLGTKWSFIAAGIFAAFVLVK